MNLLSDRLNNLSTSETMAMSQRSNELKAKGIDVINLSVAEPDFFTPDHIKAAAKDAIDSNYSFYSPVPGYKTLRQAISNRLKIDNNLDFSHKQIVVSSGAKQALSNVIISTISPGDEVILPAPFWVSYTEMVKLAGGKNIIVYAGIEQDFKISPAQLEAAITPRTKAIILCSPSNPTGSVHSHTELKELASVLAKYPDILIISNEVFEHINFVSKHESIAQFENVRERVVIINSVSKAYAMTGWRIGYAAAPQSIADACHKLQSQYTSGPCSIAQKAAEAALTGNQECLEFMKTTFKRRRDLMVKLTSDIHGFTVNVPEGAFFLFPDISYYFGKSYNGITINNSNDLAMWLLDNAHVACVGGIAFGAPNCIRLSYAASDQQLIEAMRRVKEALAKLY
ncbi:MAG: pyridoxal phosphate-dependent aminotransferase [Bacteroidales bacterium]